MKNPARFIFSLFLIPYSLFLLTSPTFAQTNEPIPQNTHNYVQTVMIDTMAALTCQLTGIDPTGPDPQTGEPKKCLGYDPITGALGFVGQSPASNGAGAIGAMGGLIAVLYNPPLSTGEYFRYLASNFGLAKPAYAQGVGFEGLRPLLALWTVFRNLVYILFAVAFVLVGLAIMLRVRIDPRTVMTIQNQIPKLIIALLLVTFSYAIAGLLVDLMYVVIYLLFGIVPNINLGDLTPDKIHGENPFGAFGSGNILEVVGKVAGGVSSIVASLFSTSNSTGDLIGRTVAGLIGGLAGAVACSTIVPPIGPIACGLLGLGGGAAVGPSNVLGGIGGFITFLIVLIAVLWSLFRLWFALIMAYVMLLIDVVFAPFWILVGVLPGTPIGFGAWLRSILSNLSPFPVTIGMFLLAKIFMESVKTFSNPFVPPLIGNPGQGQTILASFIGLGFILLTPQVVTMTKDFLKTPVFKYIPAIGQAIGVGPAVTGGVFTQVLSPFSSLAMFSRLYGGVRGPEKLPQFLRRLAGFAQDERVKPGPGQGTQDAS